MPDFAALALTAEERTCLEKHCPYFTPSYLDHLAAYRFKPKQVTITFVPVSADEPDWGDVEIEAVGLWSEAIFWEVPLMACLSEQYFRTVDTDWNYDGQSGGHRSHHRKEDVKLKGGRQRRHTRKQRRCSARSARSANLALGGAAHIRSRIWWSERSLRRQRKCMAKVDSVGPAT